ncbi:ubiquitin carboxyl-terminal hydrolase 47-like isoform X2 [Rhincodon typus]|uniref:ubiquitin carboxyl-terminal hydrolase 47-like isoform X2 n=1 Tax=Rhincodon typus TaxID=259920 RepID=UPI00202F4A08|nr:ubiquitin carboxyl-terminal hydrolase 47-like isoform X2 [Rhincodon typus]
MRNISANKSDCVLFKVGTSTPSGQNLASFFRLKRLVMWWLTLIQRAARQPIAATRFIFRFGKSFLFTIFSFVLRIIGIGPCENIVSVGLVNQGATCFLNTLLQTWFMIPEVKDIIYRSNSNVAFVRELQKLFNKMESKEEKCLRTNELTMSLQLNVFEQLDIEEYFRNLINKLNAEVDQGHNILELYQIVMVQSMKCSTCTQPVMDDCFFLDLPLSIYTADSSEIKSLEVALQEFLKVVTLDNDNAPYCNTCDKKTKTETRYYFKQLPQLLTFQIKRFGVVSNGMYYQKIHLQISIPWTLQFNKSLDNDNEWCFTSTTTNVRNEWGQNGKAVDPKIKTRTARATQQEERYELFAIWHHIGGYGSGHYYAEIKCGDSWNIFNDEKIKKKQKKENPLRSETAYLIMYRRKNGAR